MTSRPASSAIFENDALMICSDYQSGVNELVDLRQIKAEKTQTGKIATSFSQVTSGDDVRQIDD
jgi:hypothetical protein